MPPSTYWDAASVLDAAESKQMGAKRGIVRVPASLRE